MVTSALARDTVFALRHQIARLEGTLPATLDQPETAGPAPMLVRRRGAAAGREARLATGVDGLDAALGGGVPKAALTEIHGLETRDGGAVAGFTLALAVLLRGKETPSLPVLWIGTAEIFGEAGFPHAPGLAFSFGLEPEAFLFAEAPTLADALWIAEEAAPLKALAAVILEVRGNPARLDLTATRRLHVRAQQAGRPVFLLRQGALPDPTAAPVRLVVAPAPAGLRETLAGPLPRSIGPPAFLVTLSKSRTAMTAQFTLEWNADERAFFDRRSGVERHVGNGAGWPAHSGAVLSLSRA